MRRVNNFCVVRTNPQTGLPVTKGNYSTYHGWALCRTNPDYYTRAKKESNKRNRELKARVYSHYGTVCSRCGFDDMRCLQLHHINNDGKSHREQLIKQSTTLYHSLIEDGYPGGLEVICANCHAIEHCSY